MTGSVQTPVHTAAPVVSCEQFPVLEIVAVDTGQRTSTVQLSGELDMSDAQSLVVCLDRELARGNRFVRLDLSRLTFCDYAGLRALMCGHEPCWPTAARSCSLVSPKPCGACYV